MHDAAGHDPVAGSAADELPKGAVAEGRRGVLAWGRGARGGLGDGLLRDEPVVRVVLQFTAVAGMAAHGPSLGRVRAGD